MPRSVRRIAGALLFSFFGLAQAAPQLLVPVSRPQAGGGTTTLAKAAAGTAVRFNAEEVMSLAPGSEVELTLPNGSRHTYLFESKVAHGGGMTTWIARSPLTGTSERAIITHSEVGAWGWMKTTHGDWRIYPGPDGDVLVASAPKDYSPRGGGSDAVEAGDDSPAVGPFKGVPTLVAPPPVSSAFPGPRATPTPSARVDVMFVYTRDIANKLGAGLLPMLNNLVASANQAYADSEVALVMRMVNATQLDIDNSAGSGLVLSAMNNSGDGTAASNALRTAFQPITWGAGSLRNTFGADFVAVVRDGPTDTGGIGNLNFNPTVGSVPQTTGYSVNNYCASGCEGIFAHEVGHNMGHHHDRATIAKDSGTGTVDESGVFADSHGHYNCLNGLTCNPFAANGALTCTSGYARCPDFGSPNHSANDFGTIMSYFAPKVMKFSNPNVTCVPSGGVAGSARPCGTAGQTDVARGMNFIRTNLAAYRNETIASLPGSVQFTNVGYSGSETGGTLTFTVSRAGGSSGAISVNYVVANGSALAGTDYTAASGTLNWANGDTANKNIVVNLSNDGLVEGIETLTATLSAPAGPTGVHLGYPTTAVGLVLENWPAGVAVGPTLPAGYTTGAAGAAWTVANDQAFEGTTSLRSGQVFGPNLSTYVNSDLNLTTNLGAGKIAFAYRVSSYQNYGVFEFLVNGTVVFTDTGETGWQLFFYDVPSSGSYNLIWRFKNRLTSACNSGWNPPPEGGGACADRVWIDALSLPQALASSTTTLASSLNPSSTGQSVTFTATVTGGSGTPTGTVNFRDGGSTVGSCSAVALNGSGVATCATTALAAGTRSITAVYSGSATYAGSTSNTVSQVVTGTQLLTANPATLAFGGQSMNTTSPTLTTTLTATAPVTVTSVTPPANYTIVGNTCVTLAAAGTCQITVAFTPTAEGNRDGVIQVNYAGGGPTPIFVTGTGERSLVTHYYRSILRRAPDSGGKTYWEAEAARVRALGANVNEVWFAMAIQFFFSSEYSAFNRDTNGYLTDLYTTFFNRAPDSGGLAYWAAQMAGGMPREVVLAGFMFSTEFAAFTQAIFGNATVRAEMDVVMDFYRGLLSRLPDDGGFNYWVGRFRAAQCSGAAAVYSEVEAISSGFANSPEYAARGRNNGQFVGDLYNSFLRRGGDLDGVNYWVGQLAAGARTRSNERQAFITTPEFSARVQAIINQGCL